MKTLQEAVAEFRRDYVVKAIIEANGSQGRAADMLGVHRNCLGRILAENGISMMDVRETARQKNRGDLELRRGVRPSVLRSIEQREQGLMR